MIKYFLQNPALKFERRTEGASGYDLMANLGAEKTLYAGTRWAVPTGLHLEMPLGVEAQVRTRSGLARDHGVVVLNAPGTVDSDYRGEVIAMLINLGEKPYVIIPGERIAQIVFAPIMPLNLSTWWGITPVESLSDLSHTQRGSSGHGSTGR